MTTPFITDFNNKLAAFMKEREPLDRERALSTALIGLEDIGKAIQTFASQLQVALISEDLEERSIAVDERIRDLMEQAEATVHERRAQAAAEPAATAQAAAEQAAPDVAPAPKKTRAKKAAPTPSAEQPAPSTPEPEPAPIPEPAPAVQLSAQELDAAIALALQPPGVPIPEGMKVLDTFPTVEPDDSVTPEAMRELIKRLMAATSALHAVEGLQVVRGSLAAVGALRLAEVPDWQLLNLRSAVTHGNIDLRVQIAAGEL